jgi:hypothetical protein
VDDIFDDSNGIAPSEKGDLKINTEAQSRRFASLFSHLAHMTYMPEAADEDDDPEKFWLPDPADGVLPSQRGFITDVVYYYRGREVAKLFMIWASLFTMASAVKRDAWIDDEDEKLFTNLYFLIVGDSGSGKNTATDFMAEMLDYFESRVKEVTTDINIPHFKVINPFTNGATKAGLIDAMIPSNKREPGGWIPKRADGVTPLELGPNGYPKQYFQTSEVPIVQEEMGTFMNRQLFMDDLLPWMIKAYDPKDRDGSNTRGGKRVELRNTLVNMAGNTTPVALKNTLPAGVQNDGFLSRTLLIYQDHSDHKFSRKKVPIGAPSKEDLGKRLAWIAATTWGSWGLTDEASEWYNKWYDQNWLEVRTSGILSGLKTRHRIYVLKLAALIRWQRYDRSDQLIHLTDLVDAARLLEYTVSKATPLYMMLLDPKASDKTLKVEEIIRRDGVITRRDLIEKSHVHGDDVIYAVSRLYGEGLIEVHIRPNAAKPFEKSKPCGDTRERYTWVGRKRSSYAELIESSEPTVRRKHQAHHQNEDYPKEELNGHHRAESEKAEKAVERAKKV